MKFKIKHILPNRIRVSLVQNKLTIKEADALEYAISKFSEIDRCKVYERTGDIVAFFKWDKVHGYAGQKENFIKKLSNLQIKNIEVPEYVYEASGRELNAEYKEKLVLQVAKRAFMTMLVPPPLRVPVVVFKSIKYIREGMGALLKGKAEISGLDGLAVGISIVSGNFSTAGSVIFLLDIGELLEEWTHKKAFTDLARNMALNVSKVWKVDGEQELLVATDTIEPHDLVRVHMGSVIPFDGEVVSGDAVVNQSSMTGESQGVHKSAGDTVYAGTVLEDGEIIIDVRETKGSNKYDKIVKMIEESEAMKSQSESKAAHLADKLVPYTLLGALGAFLLTGNISKGLSVLMVDFSCALKLAMPISVLSAIKEANYHKLTVKGGKFFESIAEADTLVFDKTGTLTMATPKVMDVISFGEKTPDELLKIAACLEEHFPHSVAKAVLDAAASKGIIHEELHTKVEYVVAHGIVSTLEGKRVIIGSRHFVFEDEGSMVRPEFQAQFDSLPKEYSHLFLSIDSTLEAVICIEDPLREGIDAIIRDIRKEGIKRVVMMTGDSYHTAKAIAQKAGIDEFYAEVLPEEKARFVKEEIEKGHKVMMVGDGINDTPALSQADVGIAVSDGAQIAIEIADVIIEEGQMEKLIALIKLSKALMNRIKYNYRGIVGINGALIALGIGGFMQPTTSSIIHNTSTLAIGMKSTETYLKEG